MKTRTMQRIGQAPDDLLSVFDLMLLTGESESAWRKRLARGELPVVKLGANLRVRRRDLDHYLDEHTTPKR